MSVFKCVGADDDDAEIPVLVTDVAAVATTKEEAVETGGTVDTRRTGDDGMLLVGATSSDLMVGLGDPRGRESSLSGCTLAAAASEETLLRRDCWQLSVPGLPPAPARALLMMRVSRCWEESAEGDDDPHWDEEIRRPLGTCMALERPPSWGNRDCTLVQFHEEAAEAGMTVSLVDGEGPLSGATH